MSKHKGLHLRICRPQPAHACYDSRGECWRLTDITWRTFGRNWRMYQEWLNEWLWRCFSDSNQTGGSLTPSGLQTHWGHLRWYFIDLCCCVWKQLCCCLSSLRSKTSEVLICLLTEENLQLLLVWSKNSRVKLLWKADFKRNGQICVVEHTCEWMNETLFVYHFTTPSGYQSALH